ncbi:MAG: hypothetical protein ACN6OP_01165 [Pseudomonadales bacterium]
MRSRTPRQPFPPSCPELTRDEVRQVKSARERGDDWILDFMQDTLRDRSASPVAKLLATERRNWLLTLTPEDFLLPIDVRYGVIRTAHDNATMLTAFGVEVGDYDYKQSCFYVRVNAEAYRELELHSLDFPVDQLHPWNDNHFPSVKGQPDEQYLRGAKAYLTYLVHSPANDERTTANGSDTLDLWFGLLDDIDDSLVELAASAPLQRHTEGRPDPAPSL